jgi:peptide/nickel transport system ATP-binding protein
MVKNSKNYDQDALFLKTLKEEIKALDKQGDTELLNEKKEVYRLKEIDFEDTYYNTFRIVGGLVAHPDLNLVKDTLLKWESQTRKNAFILKALRLENEKEVLKGSKKQRSSQKTE